MKAAIGIDLGGTTMDAVVVGGNGNLLWHEKMPTNREGGYFEVLERIAELIKRGRTGIEVTGVGIGVPGPVDSVSGRFTECVNLDWGSVDLAMDLKHKTGLEIVLMNDASAAAYGEYSSGALKGLENAVLMTLGTGVGGGVILRGKIYEGRRGLAMEVGHMTLGEKGFYRCSCGRNGCVETLASATALVANAHNLLSALGPSTWLDARTPFDAKIIMDGARSEDPFCEKVVHEWIQVMALTVHNLRMLFDPEVIAFGGGLSNSGDFWLPLLKMAVRHSENFKGIPLPDLVLAQLGERAGAVGAARWAMKKIKSED